MLEDSRIITQYVVSGVDDLYNNIYKIGILPGYSVFNWITLLGMNLGHLTGYPEVFVGFSFHPGKWQDMTLIGHCCVLLNPLQLIIHHPAISCCVVSVLKTLLNTLWKKMSILLIKLLTCCHA
jgi:hypothetical protein